MPKTTAKPDYQFLPSMDSPVWPAFAPVQRRQYPRIGCPMVAIMEHGNVPASAQLIEEIKQRTRTFGEFKTKNPLVAHSISMTTDHVADMQFGQLVTGQVQYRKTLVLQRSNQSLARIGVGVGLYTDKNVRLTIGVITIVEFSNLARTARHAQRHSAGGQS